MVAPSVVAVVSDSDRTPLMRSELSLVPVAVDGLTDLLYRTVAVGYVAAEGVAAQEAWERLRLVTSGPIVTRAMARSVGLCVGALRHLRGIRRPTTGARTLVVGARDAAPLTPVLFQCGLTEVALWNVEDERWLPLRTAVRDADVVIDLAGVADRPEIREDCAEGAVVAANRLDPDRVIAPGLLAGLAEAGATRRDLDHALLRECVSTLLQTTGPLTWPDALTEPGVAVALRRGVAEAVVLRRLAGGPG